MRNRGSKTRQNYDVLVLLDVDVQILLLLPSIVDSDGIAFCRVICVLIMFKI